MSLELHIAESLSAVSAEEWDVLSEPDNPFVDHAFLSALERSESVGPADTGWIPRHLLLRQNGELVGALPLYLKTHSYGEFIFDFGWAEAAMRAGLRYYPKLVSAVPLTPASGRRVLTHPAWERAPLVRTLLSQARELTRQLEVSSLHVLFCTEEERALAEELGFAARLSQQFHLRHTGELKSFDDFLASLRNSSRKQVRKERAKAQDYKLALSMRPMSELSAGDLDAMWEFYNRTIDDHGSSAYLTQAFFALLPENRHAFAAMAHDADGAAVAGALFFQKGKALYGRYWGTRSDLPMLHFELCYYLPISWGLARGLTHFEAGAQGVHKIKRGFLPNPCYSAHWAAHPGLQHAILEFVAREAHYVRAEMEELARSTPFKRGGDDD